MTRSATLRKGTITLYCQDNELSWLHWDLTAEQESLLKFVRRVTALFHEQPVFHRRRFFHGQAIQGAEAPEIAWFDPTGAEMSEEAWKSGFVRCLGVQLFGGNIDVDEHGEDIVGDTTLLLFNVDHVNTIPFVLPPPGNDDSAPWELVFDTAKDNGDEAELESPYPLQPCSVVVLKSPLQKEEVL